MRNRQDGPGKGKFSGEDPPNNCKIPAVIVREGTADVTVQRSVRIVTVVASSTILRKCVTAKTCQLSKKIRIQNPIIHMP